MDIITNEKIASIILRYYQKEKRITQTKLAESLSVDHSSISKWLSGKKINSKNYKTLLEYVSANTRTYDSETEICQYIISELTKDNFDRNKCQAILNEAGEISERIERLTENYSIIIPQLQSHYNITSIISKIKSMCHQYKDFINVSDQQIGHDDTKKSYRSWISCANDKQDPTIVTQQNYLILNFPNSYRVALVLTNFEINDVISFGESVRQLKDKNNIQLIIIFTDNEIPFSKHKYFMETYNLFFETITDQNLSRTKLQSISFYDFFSSLESMEAQFYAQQVFDRFTSYFTVIRNEITFQSYANKLNHHLLTDSPENENYLKEFVDKTLLKDVFEYSYLSRHTIYFERNRLKEAVKKLLKQKRRKTLGLVMEICFPNSFLSSSIYEKCEKILLFTSSFHSLMTFKNIDKMNEHKIFPDNVQMNIAHINPQYISNQYADEITGKVDLVILGFGTGSSIVHITEYLRHINSWLSPNGMIFISFANSDSAVLHKQLGGQEPMEITPLYFSDYWQYSMANKFKFLARIKRYTVEEARKMVGTYVDDCKCYTYPFLSALGETEYSDKSLKDEIRQIDKMYAIQQGGKHGDYITVIGQKNTKKRKHHDTEMRRILLYNKICECLDKRNIKYEPIKHPVTIDTQNLFKTLVEKGEDYSQFDLLKTIILIRNDKNTSQFLFCILPRENKISLNRLHAKLMSEKSIIEKFGKGTISPLVVLPEIVDMTECSGTYYLMGLEKLVKDYIIISSGISTESIKMKRRDFLSLMKSLGAVNYNIDGDIQ